MRTEEHNSNQEHIRLPAAHGVIDVHNHLWGNSQVENIVEVMDEVGVVSYCDLTANVHISWVEGGYSVEQGRIEDFFANCTRRHPGKFFCFTTATFAKSIDEPLFTEASGFVDETIEMLDEHVRLGARGLKILMELGLHYKDPDGELIFIDDERLAPVWEHAGKLGIPVLAHQSNPVAFFEPVTPENEHYDSLKKYPSWSFAEAKFPRKDELIRHRDNLVRKHPNTTFILPHVANYAENLDYVGQLLDGNPNVYIDFSARMDELGRVPEQAREFFIKYQDRILFGTDMPASRQMYESYFRFLETFDEGFIPPDYDGTFGRYRWKISGIGLDEEVLKKIYHRNALRIIPGLKDDLKGVFSRSKKDD